MRETVSLFRNGDKMCITKAQDGLKVGDTRNIKFGILNGSQKKQTALHFNFIIYNKIVNNNFYFFAIFACFKPFLSSMQFGFSNFIKTDR